MSKSPQRQSGTGQPAELMPRFQAKLIDWIVVVIGIFALTLVVSLTVTDPTAGNIVSTVAGTALIVGYFALLESATGTTLGKLALGLRVRNLAGNKPTLAQAAKRNVYAAVPLIGIVPVLGELLSGVATLAAYIAVAVTISLDAPAFRGRHDEFGDTEVIRTR